jgi:putative transposase
VKNEEKELKNKTIIDFRYGIIAELLNPYLNRAERRKLIKEKVKRKYDIPFSNRRTISFATLMAWLSVYKKYGKDGLAPKNRSDLGKCKCLNRKEESILLCYLEKHPEVPATTAVKKLRREGKITSDISKSSLSRFIISHGMQRKNRLQEKADELQLKFDFEYPLECVQADIFHAFNLPDKKGKKKKVKLIVFLDDATRRVLYCNLSFSEEAVEFEKGIKHILVSHGRIGMIYVDNGSTFIALQTKRILSILGISIVHSTVRRPKGRGKIERFFRTSNDSFFRPLDIGKIKDVEELNIKYREWVECEYHRTPHRGLLNKTPITAWLEKAHHIIHLDPAINLDEVFKHEEKRKVYNDSTIWVAGRLYEVPSHLIGKKIIIRFNPLQPAKDIRISYDGKFYGEAKLVDAFSNRKVKRSKNKNLLEVNDEHKKSEFYDDAKEQETNNFTLLSASEIDLDDEEEEKDEN